MKQKSCPYCRIWKYENIDSLICVIDGYEIRCDYEKYTKCQKFIEKRREFDQY